MTKHKKLRTNRRREWLRIKGKEPRGKNYSFLKKYEERKRKRSGVVTISRPENIDLPENIDFEDNIDSILEITDSINAFLNIPYSANVRINHKKIKSITIGGLVYLVGQISKIPMQKGRELKYVEELGLKRKDERIRYLFKEAGYWDSFNIPEPYRVPSTIRDNYFLSLYSNSISDIKLLNKIKYFIKDKVEFMNDYEVEYKFDDAIKEAMANSIEHAYTDNYKERGKTKGKWWVCGHYDKINSSIELVFYDYGIGIRESIKRNLGKDADRVLKDKAKDFFRSDADLIELAIKSKLTKYENYKEHDRGKGFKRFKEFAKVSGNDCEMTIVSDRGKYKYFYDGKEKKGYDEKIPKLNGKVEGMLIKWKITLNGNDKGK